MFLKQFYAAALFLVSFLLLSADAFAFNVSGTYGHASSTNSNVINLVNYAANYDSFMESDFVVFQDEQYSYYIVWGELEKNGKNGVVSVGDSSVEYIRYYRIDGSSYGSNYDYLYGVDSSFSLSSDYICTSNIEGFGFRSSTYEGYRTAYDNSIYLMVIGSFLMTLMIITLRRRK